MTTGKKGGRNRSWHNLNDPDYVEFAPAIREKRTSVDGVASYHETPLGFHVCTSEDEKFFYREIVSGHVPDLSTFNCLDKTDKFGQPVDLTFF